MDLRAACLPAVVLRAVDLRAAPPLAPATERRADVRACLIAVPALRAVLLALRTVLAVLRAVRVDARLAPVAAVRVGVTARPAVRPAARAVAVVRRDGVARDDVD